MKWTIIQGQKLFKGGNIIYWEFLTAETIQGGKYSRAESIQGQKLFMEVRYKQYFNTYIMSQG